MTQNIAKALAAAQAEMGSPHFDSENPHFRSKFASLKEVARVARTALSKHGIFIGQEITGEGNLIYCTTVLCHSSGEQIRFGPTPFPIAKNDAQAYGSATTYARRYSLSAALCLVGDDDDDGNAATASQATSQLVSQKQAADLLALIEDVGADKARFLKALKFTSIEAIPASRYAEAVAALERKRKSA
jgi:hypothetical protein